VGQPSRLSARASRRRLARDQYGAETPWWQAGCLS